LGTAGERTAVPDAARAYVHVVRGAVRLGPHELGPGDAVRAEGEKGLELVAVSAPAEVLVWELGD
ncbi:pirin family protein, partial [Streptomyces europaeiscabiei]|nr:pirin family protein [Streptomyces europaeiscabiei]